MLLNYAQFITQVADEYVMLEGPEEEMDRQAILKDRESQMNRLILGKFMRNTAGRIEQIARYQTKESVIDRKNRLRIEKIIKQAGMQLHEFYKKENRNGYTEIGMILSSKGRHYFDVDEVAFLLSKVYRKSMCKDLDGPNCISDKPVKLCFQEEVRFILYSGVAKATKEMEEVSGDSYLLREFGDGTYIAAIADGMGSGELACQMSENVLELLERSIEAGLGIQEFREYCNSFLYMRRDLEQSVTMDILECNQYTGEAHFYKNGGCHSYLIHHGILEKIESSRQAFGLKMNPEKDVSTIYLEMGDQVVMMSDGVMDCFLDREGMLIEMVKSHSYSPNEMASAILRQAVIADGGKMADDMTVLVVYVSDEMLDT